MKRIIIYCLLLTSFARQAIAQEQLSLKQQAEQLYERYEYFKSLNLYLKLANRKKPDERVIERVADCYRNMNRFEEAETWYTRAVADTAASTISHYYDAEALLYIKKFDEAKKQYLLYFKKVPNTEAMMLKLSACDSAAIWSKQASAYAVKPMPNLNTAFSEWGLMANAKDGFIFTSNRNTSYNAIDNRTGNNWFRLFESDAKCQTINEIYLTSGLDNLSPENYHIGPMALNPKGDTAYITITTDVEKRDIKVDKQNSRRAQKLYTRRLQLVMAVKKYNQWVIIANFPYNDINKYSIGHAALSTNGRLIYFTSDMPGGMGKTDIWCCEKLPDGSWGKPVNCGATINTNEEEAFPQIGGDGILYFSSKGLLGMGGYDIYSTSGEKSKWSKPVNLKSPINSTGDDFYLVTRDGVSGYLSSNRRGGQGDDDIYQFSSTKPIAKPTIIIDTPKIAGLPVPVKTQENFVVNNIYYDLDKFNIRPDAAIELDKLIKILNDHPTFKVGIASYTDSRASNSYNLALSQRRSASVVDYLVKHSIVPQRISTSAFGETQLLNECADGVPCTEAQQQVNRRTEFKLIEH